MPEVLTIRDDAERARRIAELHSDESSRSFAELLIDCERTRRRGLSWSGCCESRTPAEGSRVTRQGLVPEQPEDPTGISLAFVAMDDYVVGPMAKLEGSPVAGLGENDAVYALEDPDGRVIGDTIRRSAENDKEALLALIHAL
jgi:hypothetical protein